MNLASIQALNELGKTADITATAKPQGIAAKEQGNKANGTLFENILSSAIDNIKTTNGYLSDAENEEIKFSLGQVENSHDLSIALQKASTALQYTVAVKNKLLEAYKEIMQMQI